MYRYVWYYVLFSENSIKETGKTYTILVPNDRRQTSCAMESNTLNVSQEDIKIQNDQKTYSLVRGEISKFDETTLKRLQDLLLDNKTEDMKCMVGSAKLSGNFGSEYHSIYFKTSQEITLTNLGFWGPFYQSTGSYNVKIVISEFKTPLPSINVQNETVLHRMETYCADAQQKQIFVVTLDTKILLKAHKWIRIRFQLNGPDTCICSSITSTYCCGDSKVNFDFYDSSYQLPILYFTLS